MGAGDHVEEDLRVAVILVTLALHPGLIAPFESALEQLELTQPDHRTLRRILPREVGEMAYGGRSFLGVRAWCHTRRDERVFRVDRILEVRPDPRALTE